MNETGLRTRAIASLKAELILYDAFVSPVTPEFEYDGGGVGELDQLVCPLVDEFRLLPHE